MKPHKLIQRPIRMSRIFIPGRELASGQEFVEHLRQAEALQLYHAGVPM